VCGWNSAVSHPSCWTKQDKIIAVYLTGKAIESSPITGLKRPLLVPEVEGPRISTQYAYIDGPRRRYSWYDGRKD